jgi:hypothetical protein
VSRQTGIALLLRLLELRPERLLLFRKGCLLIGFDVGQGRGALPVITGDGCGREAPGSTKRGSRLAEDATGEHGDG